jgi:hypothetical protein
MKLPAHVLTTLSLAGAVGAVAVIATLHARQPEPVTTTIVEEASPPLSEVVREQPELFPLFAEPPPPAPQRPIAKKVAKPKPVAKAFVCGPCGMG